MTADTDFNLRDLIIVIIAIAAFYFVVWKFKIFKN